MSPLQFLNRALTILAVSAIASLAHAAVDTIYVIPGSHLDIGFTDLPSSIIGQRVATFENAISTAKADPDFHWTEEGGWVFEQWMEKNRANKPAMEALKHFLHNGQISVSAMYLTPHTAVVPELQRMLSPHGPDLAKYFDYHPTVAILNDVPSHPQSIIDGLVAKGVKYLLIGANMGFDAKPLPERLVRRPFYWVSESGKRVLTFVDPNNYCGSVQLFGLGPECAKAFNPQRFPQSMSDMNVMRSGINDLLTATTGNFDVLAIQQSYDNWGTECAKDLLRYAKAWNSSGNKPIIKLVAPEEYFKHIEKKYGSKLPSYKEEWGGQWDEIRAVSPVWMWRVREAAKSILKHPTHDGQAAVLLAMDHNVHLGEIWPKFFDEHKIREYANEVTAMSRDAVKHGSSSSNAMTAVPPIERLPVGTTMSPAWKQLLGNATPIRVRCGGWPGKPFIVDDARPYNTPVKYGIDESHVAMNIHIDRRHLPGADRGNVSVVAEIPLNAPIGKLRIAPEGSPAALRNKWLRPPPFIIAPDGVRVFGLSQELSVHAPLIFSWVLVADRDNPNLTWLQGMVVRQTLFAQLKGGGTKVLPFDAWFPGEPFSIDVGVSVKVGR